MLVDESDGMKRERPWPEENSTEEYIHVIECRPFKMGRIRDSLTGLPTIRRDYSGTSFVLTRRIHWTWYVALASLIGVVANIYKLPWCFAVWLVTNTTWAIYDWKIGAKAQAALFLVYVALSVWGLIKWI